MKDMDFPKLLYIGDVPVESTTGGAALLYRLLMTWPVDRLRIVESALIPPSPSQRLPGVEYRRIPVPLRRLLATRYGWWWSGHLFRAARRGTNDASATAALGDFKPDAVLTVAHAYAWVTASNVAKRLGVPLHLIVHDDPVLMTRVSKRFEKGLLELFGKVYISAASRLCVSPYMAQEYEKRFGAAGDVLYPSRAAGINGFDAPPERLAELNRPLTYGYAGSVHSSSLLQSLISLSNIVQRRGDRLLIFSNLSVENASRAGLGGSHVDMQPIIPFQQLVGILRERVDILFVPMTFNQAERLTTEISFPSKLADYTIVGLPLLIQGPVFCSAIRWAKENAGIAAIAEDDSTQALQAATTEFSDPTRRLQLARNAIAVGRKYFSHDVAFNKFRAAVCRDFPLSPG